MDKYGRVLIIIFFLCLINLGLSIFVVLKLNSKSVQQSASINQQTVATLKPQPTVIAAANTANIQSDLSLIKAEIRALREILGTTKSFEELSNLIKSLNTNEP